MSLWFCDGIMNTERHTFVTSVVRKVSVMHIKVISCWNKMEDTVVIAYEVLRQTSLCQFPSYFSTFSLATLSFSYFSCEKRGGGGTYLNEQI